MTAPPCINGFYLPQYYDFGSFCVCATPRGGSTSLHFLAEQHNAQKLKTAPTEAICIIRNPLERVASAHVLLPLEARRLPTERVVMRPPIEEVIDAILGAEGAEAFFQEKIGNSRHTYAWQPQTDLYSKCANPIWMRLEGNEGFHGLTLPLYNKSDPTEKPKITYRLDELKEYYREDLEQWEKAPTKL